MRTEVKKAGLVYIIICMLMCILPFAGMTVYKNETTIENKELSEFPKIKTEGKWNVSYGKDLAVYFKDHFAFRKELVSADAMIQNKVFGVSNVDTVTAGDDGWLFYTDTLDDYLGRQVMNKRQVFNTVNNLRLMQQYVENHGAAFVFTVPPNKNSLYPENMPFYLNQKVNGKKNIEMLEPKMKEANIAYVDMFSLFKQQSEVLYLKRDSHWNTKGAILAYDAMLDYLMLAHETYESVPMVRKQTEIGDLNGMLYPAFAKAEWNYYVDAVNDWSYTSKEKDVEAAWIETSCEKGNGTLLMFRDSFGNTLLPFMAGQFSKAYFSKSVPYQLGAYMKECTPEYVIVEKVERNLDEYRISPPLAQGTCVLEKDYKEIVEADNEKAQIKLGECEENTEYTKISGWIDENNVHEESRIFLRIKAKEETVNVMYEAYTVSLEDSDYGFILYMETDEWERLGVMTGDEVQVEVLKEKSGTMEVVGKDTFVK